MAASTSQLAVLGGKPAFPAGHPVPLICTKGYGPYGDFDVVEAIVANDPNEESKHRASQQRFIAKILHGVEGASTSFRAQLQGRIGDFLGLDHDKTSVVCVTSGTNALRAVLRAVRTARGPSETNDNEVIVPQITVGATVEAVIAEGFKPVFAAVDCNTWLLDPVATECAISEKTAAIVTVDWLGAQCKLEPFRNLADKHSIKLISDSAQSFGAGDKSPAIDLAYATIYSMGYPKVFTGGGSGGVIVCSKPLVALLELDATGILRHEALAEVNAFQALRALEALPTALAKRAAAGKQYRDMLAGLPGIAFQQVPGGLDTNYYQVTFTVDSCAFKLDAKQLCQVISAENVCCSADRMPCVATNPKFEPYGRLEGSAKHSQRLASTSITLPISNFIDLGTVQTICRLISLAHHKAYDILQAGLGQSSTRSIDTCFSAASIDLESKYRDRLVVPVLSDSSVHSKIIVSYKYLYENKISIDELLSRFLLRKQWFRGESVVQDLVVDAVVDGTFLILLAQESAAAVSETRGTPVVLSESGSSASVTLVPEANGKLIVRKSAEGHGIDGNGAPWLRYQSRFLSKSSAAKKTNLFVVPSNFNDMGTRVTLELPYIASHSFGELVFANVGAKALVAAMTELLALMATSVWTEGQESANPRFIEKAHFERMRRRVKIARKQDRVLNEILEQDTVILNGKPLLGFEAVMEKLEKHPKMGEIQPKILSEIHGDLNIHNIISRLTSDDEKVVLIDPRGVPLLSHDSDKMFEPGDYGYDISKLLFSLTGFSDVRQRMFDYQADDDSHWLNIELHPGSDTMNKAADLLLPEVVANPTMRRWIEDMERGGVESFELRVRVGEAAHFVADCACALGRNTPGEVVPLFLLGLKKLNRVVDFLEGRCELMETAKPRADSVCVPLSTDSGAVRIQRTLFGMQADSTAAWPYDVLEVSLKAESASTAQKLLRTMIGTYLPKETLVHLSTDPLEEGRLLAHIGCSRRFVVLVHPCNGTRGQTHMLAASTRRTTAFFRDNGVVQDRIDQLRIVHISSTGSSSRSQFTCRSNDKLLSPGTFGISPLHLVVMQSVQLPFPKPGRWVVENDSFFLLGGDLVLTGDHLGLLMIERPTSGSSSSWRICIEKCETTKEGGLVVAKSFRNIQPHEEGEKLLRATSGIFVPHVLAQALALKENDYATRTSPLLFDLVLPRFMGKSEWVGLCHRQGYGVNAHVAWQNAGFFGRASSQVVELADGGYKMAFYHFGSDSEYHKMLAGVFKDPRLNSLAYAGAGVTWLRTTKTSRARAC